MHWNAMNIQRCVFFTSIAAPDQRPMIRCQRMHRESRSCFFSRALPFRRKPRRRRVADAGRLELQHFRTTVPHRRRRFLRRNRQYLFVQDDVGIRMEVLCNGCVGDLLAELSGREVIELLGRYICSTFAFSRRTLRREAGLVLKKCCKPSR